MSKVEDRVCQLIQARAAKGLKKYGVTLERTDLTMVNLLRHLQEELMDGAAYIERIIMDIEAEAKNLKGNNHESR